MSAPEFQGEPMTRREVLLARDAYANGMVRGSACEFVGQSNGGMSGLLRAAERAFPLPVTDRRCCAVCGYLSHQVIHDTSWSGHHPFARRSLDAEPTETVTEEGEE